MPFKESKNNLKSQGVDFLTNLHAKPLINFIRYCRHLNLNVIERIIKSNTFLRTSVKNKIIDLFINGNTKFTHLYIPRRFNYKIHLIPGTEYCFSKLEFLSCNTCITNNALNRLTEICKSIKELELIEIINSNYRIVKLIEVPKRLLNVRLITVNCKIDISFYGILEDSLTKQANTVQDFIINKYPIPKILSSFVNLKRLELGCSNFTTVTTWNYLEDLSLPFLETLKTKNVPFRGLISLIENTKGYLTEINIGYVHQLLNDEIDNKRIIQVISQNCPNLKYLKLLITNNNILELEKLLIKCQYLEGLFFIASMNFFYGGYIFDWDSLFEVLVKSSPINLFKFKFYFREAPKLESLK
ncbi:hypothetical protein RclHR1_04190018 [Rhizophagus clarus]|uniref:F-box domain-containing protein n=1 Tax=Rhizophagus clarus TaxID=94130 RepID=A0A2Z6RH51_9GLOM|nr:hypothetical protein RclHR1_04190018 [Rhizophagus clarus]